MKKTLLLIFTLISIVKFNSFSQDIIYNITTKSQDKGSYLDSIHFRNLTNNNVLKLNDLPNDDFLTINLTTGNINTNVTNSFIGSSVEIQNSQPGIFTIFYRGLQSKNFLFELYNLAGQLVYCRNVFVRPNHQINIYIPDNKIYILSLRSNKETLSYKVLGSESQNSVQLEQTQANSGNINEKSALLSQENLFQINYGDSIEVTGFHNSYYPMLVTSKAQMQNNVSFFFYTGKLYDCEGNIYKSVRIGDQWWMSENLRVTTYPSGEKIPFKPSNEEWYNLKYEPLKDAYCRQSINLSDGLFYTFEAASGGRWEYPDYQFVVLRIKISVAPELIFIAMK